MPVYFISDSIAEKCFAVLGNLCMGSGTATGGGEMGNNGVSGMGVCFRHELERMEILGETEEEMREREQMDDQGAGGRGDEDGDDDGDDDNIKDKGGATSIVSPSKKKRKRRKKKKKSSGVDDGGSCGVGQGKGGKGSGGDKNGIIPLSESGAAQAISALHVIIRFLQDNFERSQSITNAVLYLLSSLTISESVKV
jgi:hypothetical protein